MKIMKNKRCEYYQISKDQRKHERAKGLSDKGTKGYENMGCYECDGNKPECKSYFVSSKESEETNNSPHK